jgi:nucleotide-binding universal stress UspA family protein
MINLKRILCPVDLSELSMLALRFAQAIAGRYRAFLTVVHVLENPYLDIPGGRTGAFSFGELVDLYREEREEEILDVLRDEGSPAVKVDVVFKEGVPHEEITNVARETETDMIVMSTCTGGAHEVLAGHTTERVVRAAPCPVLSVRTDGSSEQHERIGHLRDLMDIDPATERKILLPTDFSEHSVLASDYAISLAREYDADIIVLHVLERVAEFTSAMGSDLPGYETVLLYYDDLFKVAQQRVREICKRAAEHNVTAHDRVISGNPRHEIIDVARSGPIDLIVIGTHGRRGFSRIIQGSVAEAVVRHAPCSVLSVKRPEHDFITLE